MDWLFERAVQYQYTYCAGGADAGISDDYLGDAIWAYLGGVSSAPTKVEFDHKLYKTATFSCAVGDHSACSSLGLADFGDTFTGTVLRCSWVTSAQGTGSSVSINANRLKMTSGAASTSNNVTAIQKIESTSGNITITAGFNLQITGTNSLGVGFSTDLTSNPTRIFRNNYQSAGEFWGQVNGVSASTSTSSTTPSMRIRRVSGTAYIEYDTGGGWTTLKSGTDTRSYLGVSFLNFSDSPGSGGSKLFTTYIDDLTLA